MIVTGSQVNPGDEIVGRKEKKKGAERKVAVIGLDCVPPPLIFEKAGTDLENLRTLMDHGTWGPMRSTDPPITIPAWTTITTGRDPGELGIYGFRNRLTQDYSEMVTVNSSHVKAPRVWDHVESTGRSSILIGIPQTYPPIPHSGITVSGLPTPDLDMVYTYPTELADEIHVLVGGDYVTDVKDFRTNHKDRLLADLYKAVESRFRIARDFLIHKPWHFFMMVEIATDRLHHGFWRYHARDHRLYVSGNPYENVIDDFYRFLDRKLGSVLALLSDDTTVIVVSDHGARSIRGGIAINEWLISNGLLFLKHEPKGEVALTPDMVDWSRTKAWGEGGYYSRIFLNVVGREPSGTVEPSEYESFRDKLAHLMEGMLDENGNPLGNLTLKPEQIYRACRNVPPDLIVYFDDLSRRSIGTVGTGQIFRAGNETGPDDANHDKDGIFIMARMADVRCGVRNGSRAEGVSCLDITPTILREYGIPIPNDLGGRVIRADNLPSNCSSTPIRAEYAPGNDAGFKPSPCQGFSAEEEAIVKQRLADLGYM